MRFKGKIINQTWANSGKPNFRPVFGPFAHPLNFFREFYLNEMLGVIASYHRIQFQEKLVVQTQENGEKPHFGPDLDHQFFL